MKTIINWKVFFVLWIAGVVSVIAVLPYSLSLQTNVLQNLELPIPLPVIIALQVVQNAILFAIAIFGGLFFAGRVGLETPILDSITRGESVSGRVRAILPLGILLGVITTLIVLGLEFFYFQPAMMKDLGEAATALNLQTSQPALGKVSSPPFMVVSLRKFSCVYSSCLFWFGWDTSSVGPRTANRLQEFFGSQTFSQLFCLDSDIYRRRPYWFRLHLSSLPERSS